VGEDIAAGRLLALPIEDLAPPPVSGIYVLRALPRPNARIRAFTEHLVRGIGSPNRWDLAMASVPALGKTASGARRAALT